MSKNRLPRFTVSQHHFVLLLGIVVSLTSLWDLLVTAESRANFATAIKNAFLKISANPVATLIFSIIVVATAASVKSLVKCLAGLNDQLTPKSPRVVELEKRQDEQIETKQELYWSAANEKLIDYLNQNISQSKAIYAYAMRLMIAGFALLLGGGFAALFFKESDYLVIMTGCSGLFLNFLGASILVIYKSVVAQARENVSILERINTVGMSFQLLEGISDGRPGEVSLKDQTKAEVANKLVETYLKHVQQAKNE